MTEQLTFTMIKPDAVEKKHMASILSLIANSGFEIISNIFLFDIYFLLDPWPAIINHSDL